EIDPVGLQTLERGLDLAEDPAAAVAGLVGVVAHRAVELRRKDDVVALALDRLADDLLGFATAVDVRRVDEVDPGLERCVDDPVRFLVVAVAPLAEHHGAEAERRDLDAGAPEGAMGHGPHATEPGPRACEAGRMSAYTVVNLLELD